MWASRIVAAVALVAAAWSASPGAASADPDATPAPGPAPKTTIDHDGTYAVGTDIQPGTYSSAGPGDGGVCYWKRANGDTIVDNAMTKKPQVVQIDSTDTTFTTNDCQTWQLAECPPVCAPAPGSPWGILGDLNGYILSHQGAAPPAGNP